MPDVDSPRVCLMRRYAKIRRLAVMPLLMAVAPLLAGCLLPAAAPTSRELLSSQPAEKFPYVLVKLDSRTAFALQRQRASFGTRLKAGTYIPKNMVRPGDAVAITVYETGGSSLFPSPESRISAASLSTTGVSGSSPSGTASANTIPPQTVEADGTIAVPFVGRMKVAGLTPGQIGQNVEKELRQKAVAPQVVVTLMANSAHAATVSGEVNAAKLVNLSLRGERLLDVIAAAGGAKYPAYESYVHVVRGTNTGTMLLQSVVSEPTENLMIRPGDQIYLTRNPRTYVVLGATLRPATFTFDREKVTLAEAIAQAGGPIDSIGDPSGIYLFRFEPYSVVRSFVDPAQLELNGITTTEFVPVLYHIDLRDAEGYFVSQAVQMRDKDVVLVTNAEGTQLQKLLAVIRGFTGIAYDLKRQYVLN